MDMYDTPCHLWRGINLGDKVQIPVNQDLFIWGILYSSPRNSSSQCCAWVKKVQRHKLNTFFHDSSRLSRPMIMVVHNNHQLTLQLLFMVIPAKSPSPPAQDPLFASLSTSKSDAIVAVLLSADFSKTFTCLEK